MVCDTGSTDRTVSIAREHGAVVLIAGWPDHFARARNLALAACSADWVLSIDADETATGSAGALREVLAGTGPGLQALAVDIRNAGGPDAGGLAGHHELKLFRRTEVSWHGRVHERLRATGGAEPSSAVLPGEVLRLVHAGYQDPAVVRAKAARNARLCQLELTELLAGGSGPDELARVAVDLGRSYLACAEPDAAVAALQFARSVQPAGALWRWATDFLARLALSQERPAEVLELAEQLAGAGGPADYCNWLRAQALTQLGRLEQADRLAGSIASLVDVGGNQLALAQVGRLREFIAAHR